MGHNLSLRRPFEAGKVLGGEQRSGAAATREGFQRVPCPSGRDRSR